jgi:NADH:ubiquinone oxidoreductase subunit F (NADH-binding)
MSMILDRPTPTAGRRAPDRHLPRLLAGGHDPSYAAHLDHHGPLPSLGAGLIDEVSRSGLRGRGGAGFPTGRKMAAVAGGRGPAVVVANGTEGEPLSDKDRSLLEHRPHLVLDGVAAAAAAVGADRAVVCVERAHPDVAAAVGQALSERRDRLAVRLALTPSRYVAGQETALVRWLDGGEARPVFGARPFARGVGGRPTLVDNVETLAHVALIARYGAEWYRQFGTADEPGTALVTVSGAVARPGVYEVPIGSTLRGLLDAVDAAPARAVLLGGYFGTWVPAERIPELTLSAQGLAPVKARLGCGVVCVMPEDACAVQEVAAVSDWYASQSAGQCGACVFGLADIATATHHLADGDHRAEAATRRWTGMVRRRGACQLPDGAAGFVDSALDAFVDELEEHHHRRCTRPYRGYLPAPAPGGWR